MVRKLIECQFFDNGHLSSDMPQLMIWDKHILHNAINKNHYRIFCYLIKSDFKYNWYDENQHGVSLLMRLLRCNDPWRCLRYLEVLLVHCGSGLRKLGRNRDTPVHVVIRYIANYCSFLPDIRCRLFTHTMSILELMSSCRDIVWTHTNGFRETPFDILHEAPLWRMSVVQKQQMTTFLRQQV